MCPHALFSQAQSHSISTANDASAFVIKLFLMILTQTDLKIKQTSANIKTHGSVSCGPRSRRVTPVSILTGRKKTQFTHLRSSVLP